MTSTPPSWLLAMSKPRKRLQQRLACLLYNNPESTDCTSLLCGISSHLKFWSASGRENKKKKKLERGRENLWMCVLSRIIHKHAQRTPGVGVWKASFREVWSRWWFAHQHIWSQTDRRLLFCTALRRVSAQRAAWAPSLVRVSVCACVWVHRKPIETPAG